jgi:hypothetical protein
MIKPLILKVNDKEPLSTGNVKLSRSASSAIATLYK